MTQAVAETLPVLLPGQQRCDRDPTQVAVWRYRFPWGESGVCCAEQGAVLKQLAENLNRSVELVPLGPPVEAPITRDERITLRATIGALEAELEEAKQRGARLFESNTSLVKTNRLLELRIAEAVAQIADATKVIDTLRGDIAQRDSENAELVAKLDRAQTAQMFQGHVVDGAEGV